MNNRDPKNLENKGKTAPAVVKKNPAKVDVSADFETPGGAVGFNQGGDQIGLEVHLRSIYPREEEMGDFECSISLSFMTDPVETPCKHKFEKQEIEKFIQTHTAIYPEKDAGCPTCGRLIKKEELKRVVLALPVERVLQGAVEARAQLRAFFNRIEKEHQSVVAKKDEELATLRTQFTQSKAEKDKELAILRTQFTQSKAEKDKELAPLRAQLIESRVEKEKLGKELGVEKQNAAKALAAQKKEKEERQKAAKKAETLMTAKEKELASLKEKHRTLEKHLQRIQQDAKEAQVSAERTKETEKQKTTEAISNLAVEKEALKQALKIEKELNLKLQTTVELQRTLIERQKKMIKQLKELGRLEEENQNLEKQSRLTTQSVPKQQVKKPRERDTKNQNESALPKISDDQPDPQLLQQEFRSFPAFQKTFFAGTSLLSSSSSSNSSFSDVLFPRSAAAATLSNSAGKDNNRGSEMTARLKHSSCFSQQQSSPSEEKKLDIRDAALRLLFTFCTDDPFDFIQMTGKVLLFSIRTCDLELLKKTIETGISIGASDTYFKIVCNAITYAACKEHIPLLQYFFSEEEGVAQITKQGFSTYPESFFLESPHLQQILEKGNKARSLEYLASVCEKFRPDGDVFLYRSMISLSRNSSHLLVPRLASSPAPCTLADQNRADGNIRDWKETASSNSDTSGQYGEVLPVPQSHTTFFATTSTSTVMTSVTTSTTAPVTTATITAGL